MSFLQSIIYGFVSGLTEFIPISSRGHQAIMLELFGQNEANPILNILIHLAVLVGIYFSQMSGFAPSVNSRTTRGATASLDRRFVKAAAIPMLVGILLITYLTKASHSLLFVALFALINGIILFVPSRMLRGNKDSRSMSMLDGILSGLFASLSAFPGISRVGAAASYACARGAHRHHALNWAMSLSVPAICIWLLVDIFQLFTAFQPAGFWAIVSYLFAAVAAFGGTYIGIRFIKILIARMQMSVFAYYSWGAALFAFILYLI